ncbi:unnamed protein product [Dibothriocephalus latus]|uniref:Uncharacterized protein n=1 Tax=Dibothriocephalus latus TaxID=60516 RepID=A0A3P6QKB7_DIBLA|nr:unnamed protein product [Dibothriocephalus latus]
MCSRIKDVPETSVISRLLTGQIQPVEWPTRMTLASLFYTGRSLDAVQLGKDPNAFKREPPSPKHLSTVADPATEETSATEAANQEEATPSKPGLVEDAVMKDQTPSVPSGDRVEEATQEPRPSGDQPEEETETGPVQYRMDHDPVILNFVREKLQSHPILALSELTKACQVRAPAVTDLKPYIRHNFSSHQSTA